MSRITDNMLIRALQLGATVDRIPELIDLFVYREEEQFIENYLKWNDSRLMDFLNQPEFESTLAGKMFRKLNERRLLKRVFSRPLAELEAPIPVALPEQFRQVQSVLESAIAEELSRIQERPVTSPEVILNLVTLSSVQMKASEGAVLVLDPLKPVPFEQRSMLFQSIDQSLREEHLECYAPIYIEDESRRRRLKEQVAKFIVELLRSTYTSPAPTVDPAVTEASAQEAQSALLRADPRSGEGGSV